MGPGRSLTIVVAALAMVSGASTTWTPAGQAAPHRDQAGSAAYEHLLLVNSPDNRGGRPRTIDRLDLSGPLPEPLAPVSGARGSVLVSPDGTRAFVVQGATLVDERIRTGARVRTVTLPGKAYEGSVSADGSTVWVTVPGVTSSTSLLVPYAVGSGQVGPAITVADSFARAPLLTPDGRWAYFFDHAVPLAVDLRSGHGTQVAPPSRTFGPAVLLPDGTTMVAFRAWGPGECDRTIVAFDARTGRKLREGPHWSSCSDVEWLGNLAPDGQTIYYFEFAPDAGTKMRVMAVDPMALVADPSVRTRGRPLSVVIDPDGRYAYVSNATDRTILEKVDLETLRDTGVNVPVTRTGQLAVTPPQAPTAAFTAAPRPAGRATDFDGSGSTGTTSPVVRYRWAFGDGQQATTSTPRTTHTYIDAGTFTVRLTVTDAYGVSTTRVYDGRQVLRNGGPQATATRTVVIG